MSDSVIEVPANSYTNFKLTYSNPRLLHEHGKVILLGVIPAIWFNNEGPGVLKRHINHIKKDIKSQMKSLSQGNFDRAVQDESAFTAKYSIAYSKTILASLQHLLENPTDSAEEFDSDSNSDSDSNYDYDSTKRSHKKRDSTSTNDVSINIPLQFSNGRSNYDALLRSPTRTDSESEPTGTNILALSKKVSPTVPSEDNESVKDYIDTINKNLSRERTIVMPKTLSSPFENIDDTKHDSSKIHDVLDIDSKEIQHADVNKREDLNKSQDMNKTEDKSANGVVFRFRLKDLLNGVYRKRLNNKDSLTNTDNSPSTLSSEYIKSDFERHSPSSADTDIYVKDVPQDKAHESSLAKINNSIGGEYNNGRNPAERPEIPINNFLQVPNEESFHHGHTSEHSLESKLERNRDDSIASHSKPSASASQPKSGNNIPTVSCEDNESNSIHNWPHGSPSDVKEMNQVSSTVSHDNVDSNLNLSSVISRETSFQDQSIVSTVPHPTVKWGSSVSKKTSRRSGVSLAKPEPMDHIDDVTLVGKNDWKIVHQLYKLASKSKKKYENSMETYRQKVFLSLLKKYNIGEIIKVSEMLVLIKALYGEQQSHPFTENEYCDSYVRERWKEYYAVLRKTDSSQVPITLQLFDIEDDNFEKDPSYSIHFRSNISIQFYSEIDKSISIVVPGRSRTSVYILKCHNQVTAFRWLFILKQALGHSFADTFTMSVPELSLTLHVAIPPTIIYKTLLPQSTAKIHELENGYQVEYSPLIEYLSSFVRAELAKRNIPRINSYVHRIEQPWFCYKKYDRLEWTLNNSEIFYIQYLLLQHSYKLEVRKIGNIPIDLKTENETLVEPTSIEGFLSRITNMSGKQESFLRSFHKVLYFYTCENLLFFTTYYKAVPPSPENKIFKSETDASKTAKELPEIYEYSAYPLDDHNHITWLKSDDFHYHDNLAREDYERRVQQIIKAEGLIDLSLVKDVVPIPLDKIKIAQKILQCMLWYSNPNLIGNNFIVDSGLEIIMHNGSRVKLVAPNTKIRDEWICRLIKLKTFWGLRKRAELLKSIEIKLQNQKSLNISEFQDSNADQEIGYNEMSDSRADSILYNIDAMALSRCVLVSGILFQKSKKHADFNKYYAVLIPGYMILYKTFKRSKITGMWKRQAIFKHFITIPISRCYVYSGITTSFDLLDRGGTSDPTHPEQRGLPRVYPDGWKSSEEEHTRCFTLWFGRKRLIRGKGKVASELNCNANAVHNPGLSHMIAKLGITGKSIVFMTRSRQERETWTHRILCEIDRHCNPEDMASTED